jgi:hypothetical protein
MKKIEVTIGFKYVDDNGNVVKIESDFSDNGYCYKDLSAWEKNEGIIYASEYDFEKVDDKGNFIEEEELKEQWTRESWVEWVKGIVFHHNYEEIATLSDREKVLLTNKIAYDCLCVCDFQGLDAQLEGWNWEDCVEEFIEEIRAKNRKSVWCVKTHIVDDYETITDEVRLFNALEDAEKVFSNIVDEERRIANDKEWVIECDDNRYFEAYYDGYYTQNHSCVNLFEIEIE